MRSKDIRYGGSLLALIVGCLATAQAQAQTTPNADEIVVTGTSIRGAPPIGSGVVSVGREAIEQTSAQTVQQILRSVPALTGLGATPQGGNPGNAFYAPTIHSLGSSSSNSTLVLVDGHRISPGSQQQTLTDPNMVPPIALERVEVLAEGASSVYGSDAVAGVVNFITRRNYDGLMVTGQAGWADGWKSENAGVLWGNKWDDGSVMLAYNYSHRSSLATADRDFLNRDHTAQGGTNFGTFFCSPATIQPQGVSNIYLSATSATNIANTAANSPCQKTLYGDAFPDETRNNAMLKVRKDVSDKLSLGLDVVYSVVENTSNVARGTLTTTVFRTGTQANPFYVNPPGVVAGTTAGDRQQVRWDADALLGPGATSYNNNTDYYVAGNGEYRLSDKFQISFLALHGAEDSSVGNKGLLCGSCANLALNGTTNAGGSLTQVSVPGTTTLITQLPLTAANALDVWNPPGSNRTSADVLKRLVDNYTRSDWYYKLDQARVGLNGELFNLPAGPIRFAVGAEYAKYELEMVRARPNNTGPSSSGTEYFNLLLDRSVKSGYVEMILPIISEDQNVPLVRKLELNLSDRMDDYDDTGQTENPRIAFGWEVVDGLRLRGNYSESFVAPQLSSYGDRSRGGLTSFSGYGSSTQTITVPISNFPLAAQLPGAVCNGVTCTIGSASPGISLNGGPADPQPGRGVGWSFGVDLAPPSSSLKLSATLFNTRLINQITGTSVSNAINSTALNSNLRFFPNGATAADIQAVAGDFPQTSVLPATIYYILSVRQQNVLNLNIQGIDASADYQLPETPIGVFSLGGSISYFTKFDQKIKGGQWFSVLGSTGFNNTFPSIRTQARGNVGWKIGGFEANVFANHISSYRNWSGTTVIPVINTNGNPAGGGDKVKANTLYDLNLTYNFKTTQVFANVDNVFDKDPPFYNSASGVDSYGGNILGRVVTVGFRSRF
jgi:iron complex outermembrane receptor protein